MQRTGNRTRIPFALALTLALAAAHGAAAQQASEVAVKLDSPACSAQSREVAYKTLITIAPWLLARAERLTAMSDAERRAFFRSIAEQQLWRTGMPAGGDNEG